MCERPPFWRWLPRVLVEKIRALPGLIGVIRDPAVEGIIGLGSIVIFLILALSGLMTSTIRVIMALCTIPSFIIMMHGIYRMEGDC